MVSSATTSDTTLSPTDRSPQIDNLIIEDDTPVDNFFSAKLQRLLVEILYSSWVSFGMNRSFIADADIGIFSSVHRPPIVPDMFISLDVEVPQDFQEKKNRTYFVWEFGKSPDVVVEVVSNKKGNELGSKLRDYARLGVSYYIVFDPLQQLGETVLYVFGLNQGEYERLDQLWLENVGLGVALWEGTYEGLTTTWLRWCDRDGQLLPTGAERATQAEAKVTAATARADKLAEQLRSLGVDPDALS